MTVALPWLLLLVQFPAVTSSVRVALWRRLRAAGAARVNGGWLLPATDEHASLFERLADGARAQGAQVAIFTAQKRGGDTDVLACFSDDRARDYADFGRDALNFLTTLESSASPSGEAGVAESLARLDDKLAKIVARDFFPNERQDQARQRLVVCHTACAPSNEQRARIVTGN